MTAPWLIHSAFCRVTVIIPRDTSRETMGRLSWNTVFCAACPVAMTADSGWPLTLTPGLQVTVSCCYHNTKGCESCVHQVLLGGSRPAAHTINLGYHDGDSGHAYTRLPLLLKSSGVIPLHLEKTWKLPSVQPWPQSRFRKGQPLVFFCFWAQLRFSKHAGI